VRLFASPRWSAWLEESRLLIAAPYVVALAALVVIGLDTGFSGRDLSTYEVILALAAAIPAGFLLIFSTFGLVSYFIFIPSIAHDGHLFSQVHGTHLIHPLTTSIVLGLAALCIYTGSLPAWATWTVLLVIYLLQTALILRRVSEEHLANGLEGPGVGKSLLLLNLILGGELVTVAAGAKPLQPWRLETLPKDTWIVDVRTKPEFHWNRLQAAENYPWGAGVIEAAKDMPKERPVLVTCFSGHRSPAVAVMLRRLGFKTVYNLNWGLLYLILLERGKKTTGPFSLTRPHRDPHRRGEDFKGISVGYITCAVLTLISAPLEQALRASTVSETQQVIGAALGVGGLLIGFLSFRALGRNFRVFAAPRRSGTLITSGVYSRVRHPMYTAVITSLGGYALYFGSLWALPFWLGCTILYIIKAVKEEWLLVEHYPEYEDYRRRSWRFVPFIF
jgi:protein-S-isoprenylcysteine O-methyltransferase Ste14/rhodanese-related sulfurtransferase